MASTAVAFWDRPSGALDGAGKPILFGTGPTFSDHEWDIAFIGDTPLPGICRVRGTPTLAFDKKKSAGVDGAVITMSGYLPGPIDVECTIWTQAQWEWFVETVAPKIWRRPKKKNVRITKVDDEASNTSLGVAAYTISHPALDLWGMNAVVIVGVSVPEDGPAPQTKVIRIKCMELVLPNGKRATKTVRAPVANVRLDRRLDPALNAPGGDPPSTTGLGPL